MPTAMLVADQAPQVQAEPVGEVEYKFEINWIKIGPEGIHLRLDTDLPDNAEVIVSVIRTYTATSAGNTDSYSQDYFTERGEVAQWRETRIIPLDADDWKQKLSEHQFAMARLGSAMAFEVEDVNRNIEISARSFAHKSGARFGQREYASMLERVKNVESVAEHLVETRWDLAGSADIQQRSKVVAWDGLEYGQSYQLLGKRTPLMQGTVAQSVEDLQHVLMPAGTVVQVEAVTRINGNFWYHVSLPDHAGTEGWINSVALRNDGAMRLSGAAPRIASSAAPVDYRSEIINKHVSGDKLESKECYILIAPVTRMSGINLLESIKVPKGNVICVQEALTIRGKRYYKVQIMKMETLDRNQHTTAWVKVKRLKEHGVWLSY